MKLLASKLYDPATAVSKATTAALAMTALDTTNLRLTVTVPSHGYLHVRMRGVLHGATTVPQIMLGTLEGTTVRGRAAPMLGGGNIAATTLVKAEAEFTINGLTGGASIVLDAAYAVETVVAATGLKYGGPNNTTANDAFGGFSFEIYDPAQAGVTGATAAEVWAHATRALTDKAGFDVTSLGAGTITAASIAAAALNGKGDWNIGKTGYSLTQAFPTNFSSLAITVGGAVTAGTVSDKTGYSLTTSPLDAAGTRAAVGLATANLDTQLGTLMTSASYTAPDNSGITAIKAKTDSLTFTVGGSLKVNVCYINGVLMTGAGVTGNTWRAA